MVALNLPDLGTSAAIAVIVLAFIVFGLVKGMVRMSFALVALTAGILAGLWGFQKGASIAGVVISEPDPWMSAAVGVILGLAIFFVARALFGVLLSPVSVKDGRKKNLALPGGLLGLIMGMGFAWFCLSGVRYIGTLAELDWIRAAIADKTKVEKVSQPLFAKIKRAVDSTGLGKFHDQFDLLNDRAKTNLAKLTVLVNSPVAIKSAALDKDIRDAVYNQKGINEMLLKQSADLRTFIDAGQYSHLLKSKPIKEACRDPAVATKLAKLDIEKALGLIEEKQDKKDETSKDKNAKK